MRKSGINQSQQQNGAPQNQALSGTSNLWQSTTINAISRTQKASASSTASRLMKSDQKKQPFSKTSISAGGGTPSGMTTQIDKITALDEQQTATSKNYEQVRSPQNMGALGSGAMMMGSSSPFKPQSEPGSVTSSEYKQQSYKGINAHQTNNRKGSNIDAKTPVGAAGVNKNKQVQQNDWQQEYNQQTTKHLQNVKLEGFQFTDPQGVDGASPTINQSQTLTGNGAQQNLFIKNLFFISNSSTGGPGEQRVSGVPKDKSPIVGQASGSHTSRNMGPHRMGFASHSYDSAPVTRTFREVNANQLSDERFATNPESFSSVRLSQPSFGDRQSQSTVKHSEQLQQPQQKTYGGSTSVDKRKAIDIAAKVLQQLAPLASTTQTITNNKGNQQQLRMNKQKSDKEHSVSRMSSGLKKVVGGKESSAIKTEGSLGSPRLVSGIPKSVSPDKKVMKNSKQKSVVAPASKAGKFMKSTEKGRPTSSLREKGNQSEPHEFNDSIVVLQEGSPMTFQLESTTKGMTETQEINLFGGTEKHREPQTKQPSYGELPKWNVRSNKKETSSQKASMISNPQMSVGQQSNNNPDQSQTLKGGKQGSRNNSEIFNYKMKSLNPTATAKREQIFKGAPQSRNKQSLYGITVEYNTHENEGEPNQEKHKRTGSNTPKKAPHSSIAKSQSQGHFNVMKKQISETQTFLRNDAMHLSMNSVSFKHNNLSQAAESQYGGDAVSQLAIGDKVSEFSINTDRIDKQCIKVVARFRPLNDIEQELVELNPPKNEMIMFSDDNQTIKVQEEYHSHNSNLVFTYDHVFRQDSTQEEVFDLVGKQMIDDIMMGYNGTIFAYGQTGSGKTFTMYGDDIFNDQLMGIVPRAARQIFNHIQEQDLEVEYSIRVQMVEIYKETLRDLLHSTHDKPPELKIKEDPKRGTYVEGLQDVCICNEEEIMTVICTGETMRHVASTQLNQVSSRSHAICMIEIVQKYPNDSEKRGILNLVDLAGSERVSRSMAQGSTLEEAKKINYSLSMLGKVINSLTKNASHIPYRDSKLTRLLKESLGGNNKTSLIVACSPHQSNFEETVSSLRFAQSAKLIKNKVTLNITTSNQQLKLIIEQLKLELQSAREEIYRLRLCCSSQSQCIEQSNTSIISNKQDDELINNELLRVETPIQNPTFGPGANFSLVGQPPLQAIHNRPHQSLASKNHDVIETNNNQRVQLLQLLGQDIPMVTQTSPQKPNGGHHGGNCVEHQKIIQALLAKNEELAMMLQSKDADLEAITFQKDEVTIKLTGLEEKNNNFKKKVAVLEKKVAEIESDKDYKYGNEVVQQNKISNFEAQIKILNEQVSCLQSSLEESMRSQDQLLKEREDAYKKKVCDFFDDQQKLLNLPLSKGLESLLSRAKFGGDASASGSFIEQLEVAEDFAVEKEVMESAVVSVHLNERDLLMQNLYSLEILNGVEEGSIPPDVTIYLLKNQLVDACMANHNLQRLLNMNRWRQIIEYGKYKVKTVQCSKHEETIATLETIQERQRKSFEKLRNRMDKLETYLNQQNRIGQDNDIALWTDAVSVAGSNVEAMTHKVGAGAQYINHQNFNQSMMSGASGQQTSNAKSRFYKPITCRALRRNNMFSRPEKSPGSRVSIGAGGRSVHNSSIMTHYYNLKNNAKYIAKAQLSQVDSNTVNGSSTGSNREKNLPNQMADGDEDFERAASQEIERREEEVQQLRAKAQSQCSQNYPQQQIALTLDELKKIESCKNLKDVKELILSKLPSATPAGAAAQSMNPKDSRLSLMILAQNNNRQNRSQSPAVGGSTTNIVAAANRKQSAPIDKEETKKHAQKSKVVKKESEAMIGQYQSTLNLGLDNIQDQSIIQEVQMPINDNMMRTMNSDCNLTNSVVMGAHGLFGMTNFGPGHFPTQNELHQLDRLQEKNVCLQDELDHQRKRAEELKKAYLECKKQLESQKRLNDEKEFKFNQVMKEELYQWELAITQLKTMNESELMRKQREIEKLHQLLAKWIDSHQTLEMKRGMKPAHEIEQLVSETITLKNKRKSSRLLNEVLMSGTPMNKKEEAVHKPSSFLHIKNKTADKNPLTGSLAATTIQANQQRNSLKSPLANNYYNLQQTPQVKGLGNRSTMISNNQHATYTSKKPGQSFGQSSQLPLATQVGYGSPSMKISQLLSEKREQNTDANNQAIRGDTSPVHHHSSLDGEDSCDSSTGKHQFKRLDDGSPSMEGSHHESIRIKQKGTGQLQASKWLHSPGYDRGIRSVLVEESVESSQIVLNLQSPSNMGHESCLISRGGSQIGSIIDNQRPQPQPQPMKPPQNTTQQ